MSDQSIVVFLRICRAFIRGTLASTDTRKPCSKTNEVGNYIKEIGNGRTTYGHLEEWLFYRTVVGAF